MHFSPWTGTLHHSGSPRTGTEQSGTILNDVFHDGIHRWEFEITFFWNNVTWLSPIYCLQWHIMCCHSTLCATKSLFASFFIVPEFRRSCIVCAYLWLCVLNKCCFQNPNRCNPRHYGEIMPKVRARKLICSCTAADCQNLGVPRDPRTVRAHIARNGLFQVEPPPMLIVHLWNFDIMKFWGLSGLSSLQKKKKKCSRCT